MLKGLIALLISLIAPLAHAQAMAASPQGYPSKPIRLIVPWPAGGDTDIIGRLVAQKLSEGLGQPVFVDNRAGGSGSVGAEALVRAPADGYTMLVSSMGTHTINQFLVKHSFDPVEDVTPVSRLVSIPAALIAHPSVPFNDVKGLVAAAKASPGKLNIGSGSNAYQLVHELLKSTADVDIQHVRYRGGGPAMIDLLSGQIEMLIVGLPSATPQVKAGKLKVIAVTPANRAASMPDVPTFSETLPGMEFSNWTALFVRAGTPAPIVEKLNAEIMRILRQPDVRERITGLGAEISPTTSDEMTAIMRKDAERWSRIIKTSGMKTN